MKIIDANTQRIRPSMFLHGITGNGKSTWAATGGTPLVIVTEPKAESVLRLINSNAVGLVPESLNDLEQLLDVLGRPDKTAKYDRIILDSFTELTLNIPRWIQARAGRTGILAKLDISEFGNLKDYALAIVKAIQLTGLPSIIIGRSTSKRVGAQERIVPDGLGKSVDELPGKLLPTAEARFDPEQGHVIDTTPADHSQRCGLPWVPQVFQGTVLNYLALIEAGPQQDLEAVSTKTAPAVVSAKTKKQGTPEPDPVWVDLLVKYAASTAHLTDADRKTLVAEWEAQYAKRPADAIAHLREFMGLNRPNTPDPETRPEEYQAEFGKMATEMQSEKLADSKATEHTPEVEGFVEGVSPEIAKNDDISELLDLCREHQVRMDAMWAYAISRKEAKAAKDGSANWMSVSKKFVAAVVPHLKDPAKRRAFIPNIHQKFQTK